MWLLVASFQFFSNSLPNLTGLFKLPLQLSGTVEKDCMYLFFAIKSFQCPLPLCLLKASEAVMSILTVNFRTHHLCADLGWLLTGRSHIFSGCEPAVSPCKFIAAFGTTTLWLNSSLWQEIPQCKKNEISSNTQNGLLTLCGTEKNKHSGSTSLSSLQFPVLMVRGGLRPGRTRGIYLFIFGMEFVLSQVTLNPILSSARLSSNYSL